MLSAFKNRFLRFCLVGGMNTAIDLAVFSLLYYGLSLHILLANTLSFLTAVANSYLVNKNWTFADASDHSARRIGLFFSVAAGGLCLSNLIVYLLADTTGAIPAKLAAILVTMVWNYVLTQKFVFKGD